VIQGPRFSTRAESRWFRSAGWEVVNMTQYPEAPLARELGMCYGNISLVTDYDSGLEGYEGIHAVTMEEIFRVLEDNLDRLRKLLFRAIPLVPEKRSCACGEALDPGSLPV
jgi:5'-methylthioadenosine phosphorylase